MRSIFLKVIVILLFAPCVITGQERDNNNSKIYLTISDSIYASQLERLTLPDEYKQGRCRELPTVLNNAALPFFRPAFSQGPHWNCAQAAGIGYNFTYEINRLKGASGDTSINQYSPNFTYNFLNTGSGAGVSYFSTFDVVKVCGNPNLYDYGGLLSKGGLGWMSGYELYENAMRNRITGVYSIDVSTQEGQETLKYWLLDHLDGSEFGGVANFYLANYGSGSLPDDSPDAGFEVFFQCADGFAGHAMTIVGFNDSIRYDINNDGRYTTNIDINEDGIIDLKDSEYGGFRFTNSTVNNDGAGYMMYRTLALESGKGGIWNQEVHVISVDTDYDPLATIHVKLDHNSRNKIKIAAGVSTNPDFNFPEHTMDFPVFNFQGGNYYMQGSYTSESNRIIELALDISPLLSYIDSNKPASYFLQIIENDPNNVGDGEVLYYSLNTGPGSIGEVICDDVPVPIRNNSITTLQLTTAVSVDNVQITTDSLPDLQPGVTNEILLTAENGYPPYEWEVINQYTMNSVPSDFQRVQEEKLVFEQNDESSATIDLPFEFPFFGDTVNSIEVYIDGFIMFEKLQFPYPYFLGEESMLKSYRTIAPFMSVLLLENYKNDGVWVNKSDESVKIRWKTSCERYYAYSDVNFCLYLYPDGVIDMQYDTLDYADEIMFTTGISAGDEVNYILNNKDQKIQALEFTGYRYSPPLKVADNISINNEGMLSLTVGESPFMCPIGIQITDSKGITDRRNYSISTTGFDVKFKVNETDNDIVNSNDTSVIALKLRNKLSVDHNNITIRFTSTDDHITLHDSIVTISPLLPNQTIDLPEINTFTFSQLTPDNHNSTIRCEIIAENERLVTDLNLLVHAPKLNIIEAQIIDMNNQKLYPGETAMLRLTLQNTGSALSEEYQTKLDCYSSDIHLWSHNKNTKQLNPGDTVIFEYKISATFDIPLGTLIQMELKILDDQTVIEAIPVNLRIGHIPVLIIDFTSDQESGTALKNLLDGFGLQNTYNPYYARNFNDYLSVFLLLEELSLNNYLIFNYLGVDLIDYLQSSGNLYLEGRSTWIEENQSSVHSMFNIIGEPPANYYPLDTVFGITETFTSNMTFLIEDDFPYINYFLQPGPGATPIFKTSTNDSSNVVISFEGETYKTIGSSIDFGSLVDIDSTNSKENYLLKILDFFDIKKYIYVDVPEISDDTESELNIYPNPVTDNLFIEYDNSDNRIPDLNIYDIHGKMVFNSKLDKKHTTSGGTFIWDCTKYDGNEIPPGLYIVIISDGEKKVSGKILKK